MGKINKKTLKVNYQLCLIIFKCNCLNIPILHMGKFLVNQLLLFSVHNYTVMHIAHKSGNKLYKPVIGVSFR